MEPPGIPGRFIFELLSFWRWACSNIHGNALRGLVAEFLVGRSVGAAAPRRTEWDACDVTSPSGLRIEVKTSAYVQSWTQTKLSAASFDIAAKRGWDAATNVMAATASRSADVYVFALDGHREKATADVLQLEFYVLRAAILNERCKLQKRISLSSLRKLEPTKASFATLGDAITAAGASVATIAQR